MAKVTLQLAQVQEVSANLRTAQENTYKYHVYVSIS